MNTLRTYYSKELAKVRKSTVERSGMGTDELVPPSKWPHFQSMAFLRDSITPRKTISIINSSIDETDLDEVMAGYEDEIDMNDDHDEHDSTSGLQHEPTYNRRKGHWERLLALLRRRMQSIKSRGRTRFSLILRFNIVVKMIRWLRRHYYPPSCRH